VPFLGVYDSFYGSGTIISDYDSGTWPLTAFHVAQDPMDSEIVIGRINDFNNTGTGPGKSWQFYRIAHDFSAVSDFYNNGTCNKYGCYDDAPQPLISHDGCFIFWNANGAGKFGSRSVAGQACNQSTGLTGPDDCRVDILMVDACAPN
jgi:hypothetical protein